MKIRAGRRTRFSGSLFAMFLAAVVLAPAAQATFPGGNGKIAYTSEQFGNPEIHTITPERSTARITTLASDDRSPAWNQPGTDIAFASNRGADSLGDFEIFRMLASGASPSPLTVNTVPDGAPAWAPGGTQLVIVREELGDTDLVILDADGSGTSTPLTAPLSSLSGAVEPAWAANGSIAFAALPTGATKRDLFTINANGTGLTNITNTPTLDEREPSWSPDSTQLAYSRDSAPTYEIRRIGANGSGDAQVVNNASADDRQPAWSPNGQLIAYVSRSQVNNDDIFVIGATGGSASRYTFDAGPDTEPDWQRVTPTACNDGIDNDGDTKVDYPADPGCGSSTDSDESNPVGPACSDGVDNDGDTKIDYPDDVGCLSGADNDETNPACSDGVDNDADTKIDYPADPGCTSATDIDEFDPPPGTFIRPKSAPLIMASLVPAFNNCSAPNQTHGPSLAFPSCAPPVGSSTAVTIGTLNSNGAASNSVGSIILKAKAGAPGPPDEGDVIVTGSVTDVRCLPSTTACGNANAIDGPDYTGALQGTTTIRITDRWSAVVAGGGSDAATVVDVPFPLAFGCVNTADSAIGGTCTSNTTFNAIVPAAIRDGKRSVLQLGQIVVDDGGPDGSSPTAPNTQFLRQGVFVP